VLPEREPFDILEEEGGCIEFYDEAHELTHERVSRIVKRTLTN
jgi:hypothetical protein